MAVPETEDGGSFVVRSGVHGWRSWSVPGRVACTAAGRHHWRQGPAAVAEDGQSVRNRVKQEPGSP